MRGYPVSWEQFHRDARALAWRLGTGAGFEIVVGIARGGLVPATIVARELGLRHVEAISIASYDHTVMGELAVLHGPSEGLRARGARVLVVDDLADTGRTALAVREMLPEAHIAAVYAKPQGRPTLDSFITEVSQDTWIHFPWDLGLAYVEPLAKGPPGGQP